MSRQPLLRGLSPLMSVLDKIPERWLFHSGLLLLLVYLLLIPDLRPMIEGDHKVHKIKVLLLEDIPSLHLQRHSLLSRWTRLHWVLTSEYLNQKYRIQGVLKLLKDVSINSNHPLSPSGQDMVFKVKL